MKAELLAPAGNLERLKWAVAYGADSVYFGTQDFSLRNNAGNFTLEDAEIGLKHLHANGRKGYITLNIYPFSDEYESLIKTAQVLSDMEADAFIVSDLGVFTELKKLNLKTPLHISTQANTISYQAALAYMEMGAKRVNLARELSLEQMLFIQEKLKGTGMETEVFVHGSVCFSYSGRCAISDYMTGRRANRGECAQPCRWKYSLMEEKRPGKYYPVFEDNRGLYFFNSRDLAAFSYIPRLIESGVNSFKLEGRGKNIHYLASVLSVYRKIMDGIILSEEEVRKMLGRVSNRGYSEGFMKGSINEDDYEIDSSAFKYTSIQVGNSTEILQNGSRVFDVKNSINAGETLEMLSPNGIVKDITIPSPLISTKGEELEVANNQDKILLDKDIPPFTILRRIGVFN